MPLLLENRHIATMGASHEVSVLDYDIDAITGDAHYVTCPPISGPRGS